jgi:hypothetical protein
MDTIRHSEIDKTLESKQNKEVKIKKMLLEATQVHELLTSTFYKTTLKWKGKMFFPTSPFDFESIDHFMDLQLCYELIHLKINSF